MILSKVIAEKCKEKWALEGGKKPTGLASCKPNLGGLGEASVCRK